MYRIDIFVDGGSSGNPGIASYAFVVYENGEKIYEESDVIGVATNNVAEYVAVIKAVEYAVNIPIAEIVIHTDSCLVVRQVEGAYGVNSLHIKALLDYLVSCLKSNKRIKIEYLSRDDIRMQYVDKLGRIARDKYFSKL